MKDFVVTLPVLRVRNTPVRIGTRKHIAYFETLNGNFVFIMDKKPLMLIIALLAAIFVLLMGGKLPFVGDAPQAPATPGFELKQASFEFPLDDPEAEALFETNGSEDVREGFLKKREKLLYYYKTKFSVGRLDQLDEGTLLELNRQITQLFIGDVLNNIQIEPHVYHFLTNDKDLNKLETALMEQVKFNVPRR